jgi:hypothetical protein
MTLAFSIIITGAVTTAAYALGYSIGARRRYSAGFVAGFETARALIDDGEGEGDAAIASATRGGDHD